MNKQIDALSAILSIIKLKSAIYFKSDFGTNWGMAVNRSHLAQFHLVVRGACLVSNDHSTPLRLERGDLIVFPFGAPHWIADREDSPRHDGKQVVDSIWNKQSVFSDADSVTTLICGHFEFDRELDHPFLKALPTYIHLENASIEQVSWLEMLTRTIMAETDSARAGSDFLATRLAEALFIQIIRDYIEVQKPERGFLAALGDQHIGSALQVIHNQFQQPLTLASIAKSAGLSRTLLANKFRTLVGQTPMSYLTQWRLNKAREMLISSNLSVQQISEMVGYTSEAAFSRVFKKLFATTPGALRRKAA